MDWLKTSTPTLIKGAPMLKATQRCALPYSAKRMRMKSLTVSQMPMWIVIAAPSALSNTFLNSVIVQRTTTCLVQKSPLPPWLLAMSSTTVHPVGQSKGIIANVPSHNADTIINIM
nr:hypothetical protein A152_20815 [Vibrio tasmaniensis 1F-187]